ncbi:MAG: glycosyltransferase family 2 protein [Oscillospiraceae bacterium]|nr:glycosyltransferase family 2 protein [Oscillospiraceae bacterium]
MAEIDVIVPVYQAEKTLEACVESVRSQSYDDWNLILIDDGSRDGSPALCDVLAAKDGRIRVVHQPNGGVSAARNRGLKEVRSPWVYFLDADDLLMPGALELLRRLAADSGADTSAGAVVLTESDGSQLTDAILPAGVYDENGIRERILLPLTGQRLRAPIFNGYIVRYLFRASILKEHAVTFEGGYLEDEIFLMDYFFHAKKLAVSERPIYDYLQNPASATHRYMADFPAVFRRFMERKRSRVAGTALEKACPGWEADTNWAGLLIAVGNEYAPGNDVSHREHRKNIRALCALPEYAGAMRALHPQGCGKRKQIVAELLLRRQYFLLDALYRLKNRR